MKKPAISNILRKLRLIYTIDKIRFIKEKRRNRKKNCEFLTRHSDIQIPPDYLIYESFQMSYEKYFEGGRESAKEIIKRLSNHKALKNASILDWGCGPGRIIRHLPELLNSNCSFYGTDYNKNSIEWCIQNLHGIEFNHNTIAASLPYESNSMDAIYGISIFTHLSEQMHYEWYNELYRILKPGGIMLLTTQGDNFKQKLIPGELKIYEQGKLVVRGNVKEGHRTYSAFHPTKFMEILFKKAEILEHTTLSSEGKNYLPQDYWIVKKR